MRIAALDGLRGIAAIIVVVTHLRVANSFFLQDWVQNSHSLLSVFYVLSGFVVAYAYAETMRSARDVGNFSLRRVGRLWPLHLVMLGYLVSLELIRLSLNLAGILNSGHAPFTGSTSLEGLWESALLVQMWGWHKTFAWNYPAYTMSVTIPAYALFCLVALTLKPMAARVAAWALILVAAAAIHAEGTDMWGAWPGPSIARGVMDFFLGACAFYVWRRWPINSGWLGGAFSIGAALCIFLIAQSGPVGWLFPASSLLCALMVYALATEKGPFAALLRTKPAQFLGEISLSVFLIHVPLLLTLSSLLMVGAKLSGQEFFPEVTLPSGEIVELVRFGPAWVMDLTCLGLLGVVIFAAWLAHRFIEAPARDFVHSLAARKFGARAPQAA
ncbi:MAG: acyltransferase family protein [Hyphomonadaceae bacterium]